MFEDLEQLISQRQAEGDSKSYTQRLLTEGNLVERKVNEEAYEVIEAALTGNREQIIYETGDLLYHLFVLLRKNNITLAEIDQELKGRRKS